VAVDSHCAVRIQQRLQQGRRVLAIVLFGLLAGAVGLLGYAFIHRLLYPPVDPYRIDPDSKLISEVVQVAVRNGCGVPGVARRVTLYLRRQGFDVVESGNFETFDVPRTRIIDHVGNREVAVRVAHVLGLGEEAVEVDIQPELYLDLTVVIGQNYTELTPFKQMERELLNKHR